MAKGRHAKTVKAIKSNPKITEIIISPIKRQQENFSFRRWLFFSTFAKN